jgi:hypothetical protein
MVGLLRVIGILTLVAVLVGGCSGGSKVEASLRDYLGALVPEETGFPVGAGPPRVTANSCKDEHVTSAQLLKGDPKPGVEPRAGLAVWSCTVTFTRVALPVLVGVDEHKHVVWAAPGASKSAPPLPPPRTYTSTSP